MVNIINYIREIIKKEFPEPSQLVGKGLVSSNGTYMGKIKSYAPENERLHLDNGGSVGLTGLLTFYIPVDSQEVLHNA